MHTLTEKLSGLIYFNNLELAESVITSWIEEKVKEMESHGYIPVRQGLATVGEILGLSQRENKMEKKKWCKHISGENLKCQHFKNIPAHTESVCLWWNFCPICGTPRPTEKKPIELPEKIVDMDERSFRTVVNQIIDFLKYREEKK